MSCCCKNGAVGPDEAELNIMTSRSWFAVDGRQTPSDRPQSSRQEYRSTDGYPRPNKSPNKKVIIVLSVIVAIAVIVIIALSVHIAVSRRKTTETPVSDTLAGDAKLDGLEFTDAYNDSTSAEYMNLKQEFCEKISEVLQGGILNRWYRACEVIGFSRGSVIVHYELTVVRPTAAQVSHTLQHLMVSGLEEELRRPNSLLGAFSASLNASLSFGPLTNSTDVMPTSSTPGISTVATMNATSTEMTTLFAGTTAELDVCTSQPCQNGGTCIKEGDGYRCDCPVCGCSQGGTTSTCELAADICVNKTQSLPHPYDCHMYVQCVNSAPVERPCPGDLVYNPHDGGCSFLVDTACAQPIVTGKTTAATTSAPTAGETTSGVSTQATIGETSTPGDVDPCESAPCQNGGKCTRENDGYRCDCPVCGCSQGGTTSTCGLADDICVNKSHSFPHPYDCHKYIECVSSIAVQQPCAGGLVFNPNVGACSYLADTACAQPVATVSTTVAVVTTSDTRNCSVVTCQNGGTCNDTPPGVRCLCPPTHTGSTCETEIISCAETVCEHGANCTDDSDGFHCDCPVGYSGRHCETEIDECASSPCQHASTCVDHVDGYTCLCGHHCGCANQASGPNCEKDPVTCDGFNNGDYIPDPDNCVLSHRCLLKSETMERTQPGVANCTSGHVFVHVGEACVPQPMCSNYTYFHP